MPPAPLLRPFVTANFALTWDAKVSTKNRSPANFSSPRDKRRLLEIRSEADAILVGATTIGTDHMSMGLPAADLRARRVAAGKSEYPQRVILSNSGRLDPGLEVFKNRDSPLHIFSTTRMPKRLRATLPATLDLEAGSRVDLHRMLSVLRNTYGIQRLLCEGGPTVLRALLSADLLDELHLTFCPRIFGGKKALTLTGQPGVFFPVSTALRLSDMEVVDDECFLRYRVVRPNP